MKRSTSGTAGCGLFREGDSCGARHVPLPVNRWRKWITSRAMEWRGSSRKKAGRVCGAQCGAVLDVRYLLDEVCVYIEGSKEGLIRQRR